MDVSAFYPAIASFSKRSEGICLHIYFKKYALITQPILYITPQRCYLCKLIHWNPLYFSFDKNCTIHCFTKKSEFFRCASITICEFLRFVNKRMDTFFKKSNFCFFINIWFLKNYFFLTVSAIRKSTMN